MKYAHVWNTWVVANLFHPLFMVVILLSPESYDWGVIPSLLVLLIFSFVVSWPSLMFSWGVFCLISKLPFNPISKYLIWLFLTISMPFLNVLLIDFILLQGPFLVMETLIVWPATAAVAVTILIRHQYFFTLINKLEITEQQS